MKKILLTLFFIISSQLAIAQNSIAKLKFEEAEEAYSKQDYKTTILKLQDAEKLLKKTNPKILYLKIVARDNQIQAIDKINLDEVAFIKTDINNYLKNYGSNDDKFKEVFQIGDNYKYMNIKVEDIKEANKGNIEASLKVAKAYSDIGNFSQALSIYKDLDSKGNSLAAYKIGAIYEYGKGTKIDYKAAMEWYKKAASRNLLDGGLAVASLYFSGKGVAKDKAKATEMFDALLPATFKKAESGDVELIGTLTLLYFTGAGVPQDYTKAYEWSYKGAQLGKAGSMADLGILYKIGYGVNKNLEKSFEWFTKAAEAGDSQAMCFIAEAYISGLGVAKNDVKAMEWLKTASKLGNTMALETLGAAYIQGIGTEVDPEKAMACFLKSANLGSMNALVLLGNMYRDGTSVQVNYGKAREYYQRAINETDDIAALRHLGFLYFEFDGHGNKIDYSKAVEYFNRAAVQGDGVSMKQLGLMYKKGLGVKKDKSLSNEWYTKAETATIKQ